MVHLFITDGSKSISIDLGVYLLELDNVKNRSGLSCLSDLWGFSPSLAKPNPSCGLDNVVPSGDIPCSEANWFQYWRPTWLPHWPVWKVIVSLFEYVSLY